MEYYFSKMISCSFDEAIIRVTDVLKSEGFGIISVGACNPSYAYNALQVEDKIGTMLPCNIVIQELSENHIEVAAVNPIASMMAIQNPALIGIAREVTDKLQVVISRL